jgi:hypothetical protein
MKRGIIATGGALLVSLAAVSALVKPAVAQDDSSVSQDTPAAYPKPSPFPISWELKFQHSDPKRIVVTIPGNATPTAFWYMTYSVVNDADRQSTYDPDRDKERIFYPVFTMRENDGKMVGANDGIHPAVFAAIKDAEKNKYLEEPTLMGGRILLGVDQERDSVAIWPEYDQRMGSFVIFASGLWGETAPATDSSGAPLKDSKGNEIELHKTLMMSYHVDGDQTHFSPVRKVGEEFIMR